MAMELSLAVDCGSFTLPTPVGVASGLIGFGEEYSRYIDIRTVGALYCKAVTEEPRSGNPPPRLFETDGGLLNSIGLANPGISRFCEEKLPFLRSLEIPFIVNVAGGSGGEYCRICERLDGEPGIAALEINLSCPNVSKGGLAFGTDPEQVRALTARLKQATRLPLIIKLTPNVTDIGEIADAAESGGADAVSCINTVRGMAIDVDRKQMRIPRGIAGLSGPAIKPIGVAAVYRASRTVSIPVIGIGGIMSGDDALEYLLAGASAVQVGTGFGINPALPGEIAARIVRFMEAENIKRVTEIKSLMR